MKLKNVRRLLHLLIGAILLVLLISWFVPPSAVAPFYFVIFTLIAILGVVSFAFLPCPYCGGHIHLFGMRYCPTCGKEIGE